MRSKHYRLAELLVESRASSPGRDAATRSMNVESRAISKQLHLLDFHKHAATAAHVLAANSVFSPKGRQQLRQPLAVSLRQKCPIGITRPVKLHQVRKVFFEKRQEYRGGARFQEKRIGKDPLCSCFARGFYQSLKVARPVRDL